MMRPGDKVICTYRLPTVNQYWLHPVYIGVIEKPGDDPKEWNGYNSEAHYCRFGYLPVRYSWGVMHERVECLFPACDESDFTIRSEAEAQTIHNAARYYFGE